MCMRKFQSFAFAGAIALAGAAGLTACSSDDAAEAPLNPTFDGESVKTQFAINVASPSKGGTRMSGGNTQNGTSVSFLGMENIRLIPLQLSSGSPSSASSFSQIISLGDIEANSNAGQGITGTSSEDCHKVYNDVNIATGTDNFLFYGTSPMADDKKFDKGSVIFNYPAIGSAANNPTAADIKFSLDVVGTTGFDATKALFATYLNAVAGAEYTDASSTTTKWSEITESQNRSLYQAYKTFITTGKLRAGSAAAVLATMQELYDVISPLISSTDDKVRGVATAIKNKIIAGGGVGNINIILNGSSLKYDDQVADAIKSFPTKYDLPEGAAQYQYYETPTPGFAYVEGPNVGKTSVNAIAVKNIAYPLPLTYFANTPLKALNAEFNNWNSMNTTDLWNSFSWTDWDSEVKSTTRTVALQNNINYGVACLNTTVKCSSSVLVDNGTNPTQVTVPSGGFKVTGILVGGQPQTVNWQFVDEDGTTRDYVIFDNDVKITASTSEGTPNYTLVFDNYCSTADNQKIVNVAIELVNNSGQEFVGENGAKVAKGQTFYLVGQLNVGAGTGVTSRNWPEYGTGDNQLRTSYSGRYPVKAGNAGVAIDRVFVQDYTTTANFKISSLKHAYVTIPDLRASNLQLGLSVDLTWQSGLTFDVDL